MKSITSVLEASSCCSIDCKATSIDLGHPYESFWHYRSFFKFALVIVYKLDYSIIHHFTVFFIILPLISKNNEVITNNIRYHSSLIDSKSPATFTLWKPRYQDT
ncbi:hypothetical protein AVEN_123764-1 [Araneus ventricosus]|uniref:Uncharacterized protein n=1 Tax=Araneus ventricosus TaxID=182803 RepID=A0A4Y2BJY7_ARAVE|nr:hypothetical protein AVEN_123764-1 [Araneus ventricosus]